MYNTSNSLTTLKSYSHRSIIAGNPTWSYSLELYLARECLAKFPSFWHHVCEFKCLPISVGDSKREHLPSKVRQRVPVRSPVARHWYPIIRTGALDVHGLDGAGSCHIGHKHKVEVVVPVDRKPYSTSLQARNSASKNFY